MRLPASILATATVLATAAAHGETFNPTDPQPTCNACPGTYIPLSELDAYTKKAVAEKLLSAPTSSIASAGPRTSAPSSSSTGPATTAPRFAMAWRTS